MRSGQAGPQAQPEGEHIPSVCRTDGLPPALAKPELGAGRAAREGAGPADSTPHAVVPSGPAPRGDSSLREHLRGAAWS